MKTIHCLIFGLFFTASLCRAQDTVPAWAETTNAIPPSQETGGAQPLFQTEASPLNETGQPAIAEAMTPDIQTLANNLDDDPTRIFNYVHDEIRYVHYFGSKKGAELTLLERSGNDFDQCALLMALLRAAGYSPTYQFAMLKMPYDNPTNHQDLHHWLGLSLQNTNWNNTLNLFGYLAGTRGFPVWYTFQNDTNDIAIQRIWVNLDVAGTNYYLDPAFKASEPVAGIDLTSAMMLDTNKIMTDAGGYDTGYSVTGLSETSLQRDLETCNSNLLGYVSGNIPNATPAQIVGGEQIVSSRGLPLCTSLEFPIYTNSTYPLLNWQNEPTNFMGTFSVSFASTNETWFTPQLEGQRLSLTFDSNGVAQLWLEDSNVLQISDTSASNTVAVIFSVTHPYGGGWNSSLQVPIDGGPSKGFDLSSTNAYQCTNASYAIMYGFEPNEYWLQERQRKLDAYRTEGLPDSSRQVTTETLNVMGLGWMVQTELAQEMLGQEWGQMVENQHRFGRMGEEAGRGYYVDVYMQLTGTLPNTGANAADFAKSSQVFDVDSYIASAMEHGIIEQLQDSNLVAASTVKMLDIANSNSEPVYLASSSSWTSGPNIRSHLVNYGSSLSTLDGLISAGYILLLPQSGSNHVAGASSWAGDGYVKLGTSPNGGRSMGMIIGGGYAGGYVSDPTATINPPYVEESDQGQPTFFNPQSDLLQLPTQLGADPVNLVDGSLQFSTTALTLGGSAPRGLKLTQYYSSDRLNSSPAGMGPGWLNSYYCNALPLSDPEGALGTETVEQMTPMIVASYAALSIYTNTGTLDPKNWMVTALISKWAVDQLINNAVSVNLGNKTIQFTKQPDGSYTPPANCTMGLFQTNGAFVLQERHGRTFKFGANDVLTNVTDQYGQFMTLAYNSNNLVTNVTDWKGRSLAFSYTGGQLISVADSFGRSVSYGYTGGDLTSYTDPEHKTTTYVYDTNNELVATYDALNRLVETNIYDGSGHIQVQLTEGDTNQTWRVDASGYQTVETDPADDQRVLIYDDKYRLIGEQDGLGNLTQTFYDGQDHVVMTISPMNETNRYIYDSNNNLVQTVDPLGFTNQFFYDNQNRLYLSLDGRGDPTTYGYNAEYSLTGQTNGAGDWMNSTYNSDGTLHSRTDAGGTTYYDGYDAYGQLTHVTYPNGLGAESFINDPFGDVTSRTDGRGLVTAFQFNNRLELTNTIAPTNLTTSVSYDPADNVETRTDGRRNVTSYAWSATRKLLATTLPAVAAGTPVTTNIYDNRDWLSETLNPLQEPTFFTNNAARWLVSETDPLSHTTRFGFDGDGRKTMTVNAGVETNNETWNADSQLVAEVDGAEHASLRGYDAAGNQVIITNRNGKIWQFQFDGANRLTNTIPPSPMRSFSQTFNQRGLLSVSTDQAGQKTYFYYDGKDRLTNRVDATGSTFYGYDADDNRTSVSENGLTNTWTYDAYNRVSTYRDAYGNLIQYQRDADGNVTNLIYPGGKNVSYTYDNDNHLIQVKDWANRVTSFTYDLDGQLRTVTRPNGTFRTLSYDSAGDLTNIWEQMANGLPFAWFRFNWNPNPTMQWEFAAPLPHNNNMPTRTMTYDDDNELATFQGPTMGSPENVTEDYNGNLSYAPLTNDAFVSYHFDSRNRLHDVGGVTNIYDGMNNRIGQTDETNSVFYAVNPNAKVPQVLMSINGVITNYYVYGAGLLYQVTETSNGEKTLTYHYDYRGSTIALTDDNGRVADRFEYSLYGTLTYRAGADATPFLFNGRFGVMTDPNGLLYMQARYYDPYICRFINPDPSGFSGGLNFYAYANGNPVSYADPFGLAEISLSTGIGGVIGLPITALTGDVLGPSVFVSGQLTGGVIIDTSDIFNSKFDVSGEVVPMVGAGFAVMGGEANQIGLNLGDSTQPGWSLSTPLHVEGGVAGLEDMGIPLGGTLQADVPYESDLTSVSGWASVSPGDKVAAGYGLYAAAGTGVNLQYTTPSIGAMGDAIANYAVQEGNQILTTVGNMFGAGSALSTATSSTGK